MAVELLVAAEQLGAAGAAGVHALGVVSHVLARVGALGAGLPQHRVLLRGEPAPPLGVVQGDGIAAGGRGGEIRAHAPGNRRRLGDVPDPPDLSGHYG